MGLRLRDIGASFTWHDLWVIVGNIPRNSALVREVEGENHLWGLPEQLQAATVDALNMANWLQTKDGAKGINRPKPIPRPGVEQKRVREAVSIEEMQARLERKRHLSVVADET